MSYWYQIHMKMLLIMVNTLLYFTSEAVIGRCFVKKGVIRNFAKFTGKYLYQRLFFSKVAGLRSFFIKKETLTQVFSCEFCEISKNTYGGCFWHLSKYFDKFMVTLFIRCKFKWAISFKYQLHLYLSRFQNLISRIF